VGDFESIIVEPPTAMQSDIDGHEIAVSGVVPAAAVVFQAAGPPAGLVEVRTFPASSTAAHSDADGHEMSSSVGWAPLVVTSLSIRLAVQPEGPTPGSVEVTALPAPSTATHSDADGHDTDASDWPGSTVAAVHVVAFRGLVEVSTRASPSTAAQNRAEGHDTAPGPPLAELSTARIVQLDGVVGWFEVRTLPAVSTATHQLDGHTIAVPPFEPSI
jgi:hypothetical protein